MLGLQTEGNEVMGVMETINLKCWECGEGSKLKLHGHLRKNEVSHRGPAL